MTETARTACSEVEVIESPATIRMWIHRIAVRVCIQAIGDGPTQDDQPGS
jgi:hypothetical protein